MRPMGKLLARWTGDERWELWTPQIVSHIVQGIICGAGMGLPFLAWGQQWTPPAWGAAWAGFVGGALWMTWSFCYQIAGFLKKGDTLPRDWRDYLAGWPLGFAPLLVWGAVEWIGRSAG